MDKIRELRSEVELAKTKTNDILEPWSLIQDNIVEHLDSGDPNEFLQWYPYRRAFFVGNSRHIPGKFKFLKDSGRWEFWDEVLEDSGVGNPERLPYYYRSTGSNINIAYHMEKFYQTTGRDIWSYDAIFEFGAGYGAMCRMVRKTGYTGLYAIYDLPISLAFQRFYLSQHSYTNPEGRTLLTSNLDNYLAIIQDLDVPKIFVGTMSFSEAPLSVRLPFRQNFNTFDAWLIAYADYFGGVDNRDYFESFELLFEEQEYNVHSSAVDTRPEKQHFFTWK